MKRMSFFREIDSLNSVSCGIGAPLRRRYSPLKKNVQKTPKTLDKRMGMCYFYCSLKTNYYIGRAGTAYASPEALSCLLWPEKPS